MICGMDEPVQLEYSKAGEARPLSTRCVIALVLGLCGGAAGWGIAYVVGYAPDQGALAVLLFVGCHVAPILFAM
jgi:hypothetical protein